MLDISFIRDNAQLVQKAADDKGVSVDISQLLAVDKQRRAALTAHESLLARRNEVSSGTKGGKPTKEQIDEIKALKTDIAKTKQELEDIEAEYDQLLALVPSIPSEDTPVGSSEADNVVLRTVGEKPAFDFTPKPHWEMTRYIEQERAAAISGARFAFLQAGIAKMQLALALWGMSVLSDESVLATIAKDAGLDVSTKPFVPMVPPMMMRTEAYQATGRLKPDDVTFKLANDDLWLTGSSEHSLCAYYMNSVIDHQELPVRFVGYNTAFRREVGSAGKDTRGILRVHHFNKLEMESFTDAASSRSEHEFMIAIQEYLMQQLGLHYQVVLKCTFDMGGPNIRGVDIDTWMPGQNSYRETHSADYIGDYQARGLNTKIASESGDKELAHTNDATAIADRTLIAIMEQYQTEDGHIVVPEVLRNYMNGEKQI